MVESVRAHNRAFGTASMRGAGVRAEERPAGAGAAHARVCGWSAVVVRGSQVRGEQSTAFIIFVLFDAGGSRDHTICVNPSVNP